MKHKFRFLGDRDLSGHWQIDPQEQRHIVKVLRLAPGTEIEVMNGAGWVCQGRLSDANDGTLSVSTEALSPLSTHRSVVVMGATAPATLKETLPSLCELGVDAILIFGGSGGDQKRLNSKLQDKWRKILQESCKQSKRDYFPELGVFKRLQDIDLASLPDKKWVLDKKGQSKPSSKGGCVVVGPEAGLAEMELAYLEQNGFSRARLGDAVLRAKTAAIAGLAHIVA